MKQNATKPYKIVHFKLDSQFQLPNPGLRAYLARTEEGSTEDYRTPYGGKAPREEVLGKGNTIFENWYKSADQSLFSTLKEFELELAKKVGPLSVQKPLVERMDNILEYWEDSNIELDMSIQYDSDYNKALGAVIYEFVAIHGLRLQGLAKTLAEMKLSTNSGAPYFTRKRNVAQKVLAECEKLINKDLVSGEDYKAAVIGGRGQEGGPEPDDVKQRTVGMLPFNIQLLELSFYQPFIKAVQKHCLIPAYVSIEAVEENITKLFDTKDPEDMVVVTDFKGMDQHFNKLMQMNTQLVFKEIMRRNGGYEGGGLEEVGPIKFNIPLIIDDKRMIEGAHGMSSGSGGTNADETISHRTLQHYVAIKNNAKLNKYSQALGDDGILTYPGIKVEHVIEAYSRFGQEMNPSKQYASTEDTVYLRRWYHTKYRTDGCMKGVYSSFRALGRLMGQERFYDPKVGDSKMITLRAGSILENCANHPLFEKLVDFVIEGDKYRLGLDIPGFIDGINREYARAKAKLPSFMSYTQDVQTEKGIQEGRIYKYIKSKA